MKYLLLKQYFKIYNLYILLKTMALKIFLNSPLCIKKRKQEI